MAPTTRLTSTARSSRISVWSTSRSPASSLRVPLPSPASGFTYKFDSATGTFVRSTNSFGPILSDRAETIGRGRLAFGFSHQFFSFDHLDGVRLTAVPAVFRHDGFETGGGRADVVSTMNSIESTVSQFTGAIDVRNHRSGRRIAGRAGRADAAVAALQCNDLPARDGHQRPGPLLSGRSGDWRLRIIASVLHRRVGERSRRSARACARRP